VISVHGLGVLLYGSWTSTEMRKRSTNGDAGHAVDRPYRVRQHDGLVSHLQNSLRGFRALVFVNPGAGAGRAGRHLLRVRRAFEVENAPADFVLTETAKDLEQRARVAIGQGRQFLLAMGGDGNFQGLLAEGTTSPRRWESRGTRWRRFE
jgi:hypothetical protein